jgi:hypothetical protein
MRSGGHFVVVWQSAGSSGTDTDACSTQAQRLRATAIFSDIFESGGFSRWSSP